MRSRPRRCFVLRQKMSDTPSPYWTVGYPFLPALFIVVALALLWNTLTAARLELLVGLGLIGLGPPLYFLFRREARKGA